MALYKRGKKWWYMIYVRGGKLLRGSCGTDDHATAKAVEQTMRMASGRQADAAKLHAMIDALLCTPRRDGLGIQQVWPVYERWLRTKNASLAVDTLRIRRGAVERFVAWAAARYPAATCAEQVDRACAAAFAESLSREKLSGKRRKNIITDLGAVWSALEKTVDGVRNPWRLVIPDAAGGERGKPFTREQESDVIAAADKFGHGWGLACRIARTTGLREGDVLRLKWSDIDTATGWIALQPSKTARRRIVVRMPLSSNVRAALALLERPSASGAHILPELAQAYPHIPKGLRFRHVLKAAGLEDAGLTFHSWRHTFRTRLSEAGVSDEIAKRLGGWTEDATAKHYDHDGRSAELQAAIAAISRRES